MGLILLAGNFACENYSYFILVIAKALNGPVQSSFNEDLGRSENSVRFWFSFLTWNQNLN